MGPCQPLQRLNPIRPASYLLAVFIILSRPTFSQIAPPPLFFGLGGQRPQLPEETISRGIVTPPTPSLSLFILLTGNLLAAHGWKSPRKGKRGVIKTLVPSLFIFSLIPTLITALGRIVRSLFARNYYEDGCDARHARRRRRLVHVRVQELSCEYSPARLHPPKTSRSSSSAP